MGDLAKLKASIEYAALKDDPLYKALLEYYKKRAWQLPAEKPDTAAAEGLTSPGTQSTSADTDNP